MGALHYQPLSATIENTSGKDLNTIDVKSNDETIHVRHQFVDVVNGERVSCNAEYAVHQVGVHRDIDIVDTTGAGDAFIGGYLMARLATESQTTESIQFPLDFATWVSARKLQGPGARSSLPTGVDVDTLLGRSLDVVKTTLKGQLGSFNSGHVEGVGI
jgi:sugar/nucleoside kinase (ribokinase family)